jgi:hypothetical protein
MAVIHPRSLERWEEWRNSRRPAAAVRTALSGRLRRRPAEPAPPPVLHSRSGDGDRRILLGVDAAEETADFAAGRDSLGEALLAVLPYLTSPVDVLAPGDQRVPALEGPEWERRPLAETGALDELGITAVITGGWAAPVGRRVHDWARRAGIPGAVLQHGTVTPFAPPLPPETTLLAWSQADAEFQRAGRADVDTRVVGSQRLWQADRDARSAAPRAPVDRPVFLGELRRLDLPDRLAARAALRCVRSEGALYRPGPLEIDRPSRLTHALMRRRGAEFQEPPLPVAEQAGPVVAVLSADILEAAVRGLPAHVYGPGMPSWVYEYWERYGMRRLGRGDTPAPPIAADEPARLIAQILEDGA